MTTHSTHSSAFRQVLNLTVLVAALGYFVDIFDLLLFGIVRKASLLSLGIPEAGTLKMGILLQNAQVWGLLIGGIFWGVLGDKRGRLSVLFGSITLYSIANLANAFVTIASEQFGTNLRATATTTAPNFVRASVSPMSLVFLWLSANRGWGVVPAALAIGLTTLILAYWSLAYMDETHGKDMDFLELD